MKRAARKKPDFPLPSVDLSGPTREGEAVGANIQIPPFFGGRERMNFHPLTFPEKIKSFQNMEVYP